MKIKTLLAALLGISLLAGCTTSDTQGIEASPGSSEPTGVTESAEEAADPEDVSADSNLYLEGCKKFEAGELEHKHLETYRALLEDICTDFEMNYDLVEVRQSPKVDQVDLDFYVDANVFALSYWNQFTIAGMTKRYLVLLMEEEEAWWEEQVDELLAIEPVWFGPSAEAGHCYAAEPEAICPKLYVGNEGSTTGDFDVLTTMIGSKLEWTPFRRVIAIHESTHGYQTTERLGHWRYWFVEGQATYFEMAVSILAGSLAGYSWRDEAIATSNQRDANPFLATTAAEAYDYLRKCDGPQECDGMRYVGSSFAHELLVNTYGLETYKTWNKAIAEQLPDFVWDGQPQPEGDLGNKLFAELFLEHFEVEINQWEKEELSPYLLEQFS